MQESFESPDAGLIFAETFLNDVHFAGFGSAGKTVVDAGAFVGDSTLYYANAGASVVALEPNPENFATLTRNLQANPAMAKRVRALQAAIGEDGEVVFGYSSKLMGHGSAVPQAEADHQVRVRSWRIPTLLRELGVGQPWLLKLDIKGSEIGVIRRGDFDAFDVLLVEYTLALGQPKLGELMNSIEEKGYHVRVFKHSDFKYSLDHHGSMFATRKVHR